MTNKYPTRENMQKSSDYYADYGELKPRYVAWMLAMYDDLDKRDALIKRMADELKPYTHLSMPYWLVEEANALLGVK